MPRPPGIPRPKPHKPSGLVRVRYPGDIDRYYGPAADPESWARAERAIAEFLAAGRQLPSGGGRSIAELLVGFAQFAEAKFGREGKKPSELSSLREVIRHLRESYGPTPAAAFGTAQYRAVRLRFIAAGWSRVYVAEQCKRLRRVFRWGAENGYVPVTVWQLLKTVPPLEPEEAGLPPDPEETDPVRWSVVERVLPHLYPDLADVCRVQYLAGMRPTETLRLKPSEIDRTTYADEGLWLYRPAKHKTKKRGKKRRIWFGPQAQVILQPYLLRAQADDDCLFTNRGLKGRSGNGRRRGYYLQENLRRMVLSACKRAQVPPWTPKQLRASRATEIERQYDLDHASAVLGHSGVDVTRKFYSRADNLARRVAKEMG